MRTYSSKPNVKVTVNGIPSACNTDCTYTFITQLPVVTQVDLADVVLDIEISDP